MIPVRRAPGAATLAVVMAAMMGAVEAVAAVSGEYGYGAQAAPAGQPIDLRAALAPVRKIEPETLAQRANRSATSPVRTVSGGGPAETAALTSGPASGAPIVFASVAARPSADLTPPSSAALEAGAVAEQGARPARRPDWLEPERVGAPYEAKGAWYVPTPDPGYAETGRAVAIEASFAGRRTASGETYAPEAIVAAHPTLPLPSLVQVTHLDTGREVIVRVVDRGPFERRGVLALSPAALTALGAGEGGGARVHVRYLGPAPRRVGAAGAAQAAGVSPVPADPATPQATPRAQEAAEGVFAVQVGAFGAADNAERARRVAASAGPAVIDAANGLHKVRVGPAATRAEAERLRDAVVALGFPGAIVTRLR